MNYRSGFLRVWQLLSALWVIVWLVLGAIEIGPYILRMKSDLPVSYESLHFSAGQTYSGSPVVMAAHNGIATALSSMSHQQTVDLLRTSRPLGQIGNGPEPALRDKMMALPHADQRWVMRIVSDKVNRHNAEVARARVGALTLVLVIVTLPAVLFAIGIAVAWVLRGFTGGSALPPKRETTDPLRQSLLR